MYRALATLIASGPLPTLAYACGYATQMAGMVPLSNIQTMIAAFNTISGYVRAERAAVVSTQFIASFLPEAGAAVGGAMGSALGASIDYVTGSHTQDTLREAGGLVGAIPGAVAQKAANVAAATVNTAYAYTIGLNPHVEYAYKVMTDMGPKYGAEIALLFMSGAYKQGIAKCIGLATLNAAMAYDEKVPQHTMTIVEMALDRALAAQGKDVNADDIQAIAKSYPRAYSGAGLDYYKPQGAADMAGRVLLQSTFDLGIDLAFFFAAGGNVPALAYDLAFLITRIGVLMAGGHNAQLASIKAKTAALGYATFDDTLAEALKAAEAQVQASAPLSFAQAASRSLENNFFAGSAKTTCSNDASQAVLGAFTKQLMNARHSREDKQKAA
jgi:hypothetical protein